MFIFNKDQVNSVGTSEYRNQEVDVYHMLLAMSLSCLLLELMQSSWFYDNTCVS